MWLFFPSSQSAQAVPDSTGESSELCEQAATSLAASCTASGKHLPPRTWSQRWTRGGWIRRLSSLTAAQSQEECASTYGEWLDGILSGLSAASPASHSAQPGSAKGSTTSGGFGPTSSDSWPIAAWDGACWRTSPDLFGPGSPLSPETWPRSGGVSSGRLFERPPLVLPIAESARSSSEWLSPRTSEAEHSGRVVANHDGQVGLAEQANAGEWATPRASENENRMTKHQPSAGNGHGFALAAQACEWPTPRAQQPGQGNDAQAGKSLDVVARGGEWPTATVGDSRSSGGRTESEHCNNGVTLSDHVRGKGRLNWRFVAWLMGWRWLIGDTPRPWPPGPKDADAWAEVLAVRPDLAPATAQTEPDRAAMLRLLGNGVVPEQAEAAVSGLLRRLAPVALRSAA